MSDNDNSFVLKIDQLTDLVSAQFAALSRRQEGLEGEAAEIRTLLYTVVSAIERLSARLPNEAVEPIFDTEDPDDGFLNRPSGALLH